MDDLFYLDDGVYRAEKCGPAVAYVTREVTNKKGETREATGPENLATWVHLVKIGPPVHDRGSRKARPKPEPDRDPFEEADYERF